MKKVLLALFLGLCFIYCSCGKNGKQCEDNNHDFVTNVALYPGCDYDGMETAKCIKCGFEEKRVIPAKGHDYSLVECVEASCIENAKNKFLCLGCGDTYEEEIPDTKIDHSRFSLLKGINLNQVCVYLNCPLCGNYIIAKGGHDMNKCYCVRCGRKTISGHDYYQGYCARCGEPEPKQIVSNGINFTIPSKPISINGVTVQIKSVKYQKYPYEEGLYWVQCSLSITAESRSFLDGNLPFRIIVFASNGTSCYGDSVSIRLAHGQTVQLTDYTIKLNSMALNPELTYSLRIGHEGIQSITDDYWIEDIKRYGF